MRSRTARSLLAATALGTVALVQTARAQDVPNVALPEVDVVSPTPVPGSDSDCPQQGAGIHLNCNGTAIRG